MKFLIFKANVLDLTLFLYYQKKLEILHLFRNDSNAQLITFLKKDLKIGQKVLIKNKVQKQWMKYSMNT